MITSLRLIHVSDYLAEARIKGAFQYAVRRVRSDRRNPNAAFVLGLPMRSDRGAAWKRVPGRATLQAVLQDAEESFRAWALAYSAVCAGGVDTVPLAGDIFPLPVIGFLAV
jgi:hypothetical protein